MFDQGPTEAELEELRQEQEKKAKAALLVAKSKEFKTYDHLKDDHRCKKASYYGGFQLLDTEIQNRLRSAGKELIMAAGKKILSGSFNLTKISFPIKCMCPTSMLELMPTLQSTCPIYLNYAASISDPIERMKLVMTQSIAFFWSEKIFEKPLNPILGETFEAYGQDGCKIYVE